MGRTIALCISLAFAGCAAAPTTSIPLPTPAQRAAAQAAGFEIAELRDVHDVLPSDVIEGAGYRVDRQVASDGRANLYTISSDFGSFSAHGDAQLLERIREIEALAAMATMSRSAEFAKAAGLALTSPFVATWNLITHPVDSIRGIPTGAWEALRKTAQLTQGERSEFEDSALSAFVGFENQKREIAAELDVDPYSSNPTLQKQLNRFAWAAYAGSLPVMFVPFSDRPDEEPQQERRVEAILVEYSPEDVGRLNRIELAVMGIPSGLADAFISHRWYSPRHETLLVDALAGVDLAANRAAFIEAAVGAGSESEAVAFVHNAMLLRHYNDEIATLVEIVVVDRATLARSEQTLVVPLAADYAAWTPDTQALCGAAHTAQAALPGIDRSALVVSGGVSTLTRERVAALGIELREHALQTFAEPGRAQLQ